jgi:hypothetical protein
MKKRLHSVFGAGFVVMALVFASTPRAHVIDTNVVKWDRIIGFSSTPFPTIGGISAVGFPWTAQDGKAWVDLGTGQIKFNVKGLVLAGSTPLAVAGTIGVTTKVKGTLVCNGLSTVTSTLVDTPSVPLDPQGNAEFVGQIVVPTDCLLTTDTLAFVIRVAEAAGNPSLVDKWNAVGVVRTP